MKYLDVLFKIKYRLRDFLFHFLWKLFIGKLGSGSFIKSGVKIVGNPYRLKIGDRFKIWENCILSISKGHIIVGNDGLLGVGCILNAGNRTIQVGNGVAIAPHCKIFAYSHHYEPGKKIVDTHIEGDVIIKDDVLIGAGSIILPNVVLGKGCIIAAGSVVNKSIADYTIVGGVPAKFIKKRI